MFTVDDTCDKKNRHYNLKSSPEQLTSLTTRREMTSVFREIPSNYWLLLFSTEESQIYSDVYEKDSNSKSPTSLSKMLEILSNSHKCQFIGRIHTKEDSTNGSLDEFCEAMPTNHHHVLLYLPQSTNAETMLKQTISQVLSNEQWAKVRLLTVSYPENFLKTETSTFCHRSLIVEGERMKSLMTRKTTESLGCSFNCVWELNRHNSLGDCPDNEKALYIFQKLVELEKSDAPFKDTVISYIELLQRGIGRLFLSEHSRILDIDLGVSNAQCMCFECLNQPLQLDEAIDNTPSSSQLFSPYNEDTIIDTSFL